MPSSRLSDNGRFYPAGQTRTSPQLSVWVPCVTVVRSPESNGIGEAFVKSFIRDYVRINPLPIWRYRAPVDRQWVHDKMKTAVISGLKLKSPREFHKVQQT